MLEFEDFLDHKDVGKLDPELLLTVLPNQLHLLSILMQDEQLFVEVCDHVREKYKEAEKDEDLTNLKRIIQVILMPTRSLKPKDSEKPGSKKLNCTKRVTAKLQSLVDIKLDHRNRHGYQSVAQKILHNKNTSCRDALIRVVTLLKDECNLAMFMGNLSDLEVFFNTLTP